MRVPLPKEPKGFFVCVRPIVYTQVQSMSMPLNVSPAPQGTAQAEIYLSHISVLTFWPGCCLAEPLSPGLSFGSLARSGGSLSCSWQEPRHCLRARAQALLLPHSFENGEEHLACAGCNPSPDFLHSVPRPSVTLNIPFVRLTELVLWVCNSDLPETP